MKRTTWEEAVRWYRAQPGAEAEILANYFDLPVRGAAERYARSEEFAEICRLLGPAAGRIVLDVGAGNGIASYALASQGWQVAALEPDPSAEVGAGAIRQLAAETGLPITVAQEWGEKVPFSDGAFHAVFARQVLHHAQDLEAMVCEVARVLRPGGVFLALREHIADDEAQLAAFRARHPLHALYGGENAFPLPRYLAALGQAGLRVREIWGPLESVLNFHPGTEIERLRAIHDLVSMRWRGLGRFLRWSHRMRAAQARRATRIDATPGRLFSFLAENHV